MDQPTLAAQYGQWNGGEGCRMDCPGGWTAQQYVWWRRRSRRHAGHRGGSTVIVNDIVIIIRDQLRRGSSVADGLFLPVFVDIVVIIGG